MARTTNRLLALLLAAALLIAPIGAAAEAWSAPFSSGAIQPISDADSADILAYLNETSMGLDPDEADYRYGYSIEGRITLNGRDWYVGRWRIEYDDHIDLMTDFLLDAETLEMYPCTYPEVGRIRWTDEAITGNAPVGDTGELALYKSEKGFSLLYDAAYLTPLAFAGDRFTAASGASGISFEAALIRNLSADGFDAYLAEVVSEDEATYGQLDSGSIPSAVVMRGANAVFYYMVSFGGNALAITAQCPANAAGEWGARFDQMAASITF